MPTNQNGNDGLVWPVTLQRRIVQAVQAGAWRKVKRLTAPSGRQAQAFQAGQFGVLPPKLPSTEV